MITVTFDASRAATLGTKNRAIPQINKGSVWSWFLHRWKNCSSEMIQSIFAKIMFFQFNNMTGFKLYPFIKGLAVEVPFPDTFWTINFHIIIIVHIWNIWKVIVKSLCRKFIHSVGDFGLIFSHSPRRPYFFGKLTPPSESVSWQLIFL